MTSGEKKKIYQSYYKEIVGDLEDVFLNLFKELDLNENNKVYIFSKNFLEKLIITQ